MPLPPPPAADPDLHAWIVATALKERPPAELVEGVMRRLAANGVPICRAQASFRVLHPLFEAVSITWTPEDGVQVNHNVGGTEPGSPFLKSPFYRMLTRDERELRRRLDRDGAMAEFPIFADLRAAGVSEYAAFAVGFGEAPLAEMDGIVCSFSTRAPHGFAERDIAAIRSALPPLALALRVGMKDQIARSALDTFHGSLVGRRILSGAIKRGAGERLTAALWYSDLRNSTGLADALPVEAFLDLLNGYFECTAGAVLDGGGQVLDIVGDAVIALFPDLDDEPEDACRRALDAALEARRRLAPARGRGLAIEFGVGLHYGDMVFGNAGTPERLKFGVVGRAVNEVARTAAMSKTLGRPIVLSDALARQCGRPLDDLGLHELRGIPTPRRLWAPR